MILFLYLTSELRHLAKMYLVYLVEANTLTASLLQNTTAHTHLVEFRGECF